jgi:hypothetical membrane protein
MKLKLLALCGIVSPIFYHLVTFLGGAMRPGYSHVRNTVSELMAPGSPNKLLMHFLFTIGAVLSVFFGIGVWQYIKESGYSKTIGLIGAGLLITIGVITILTSAVFPQDPQHDWDAPPTFAGQMHKILAMGVLPVLSLVSTLLIGIWMHQTGVYSGFGLYSYITLGAVVVSAVITFATMQQPVLGLTERITVIVIQQWSFVLALKIFFDAK